MAAFLSVPLQNEPGALAGVLTTMADAGIGVRGLHAQAMGELGVARLLVDDAQRALSVLASAGQPAQLLEGVDVTAPDAAGLGEICRRLGAAGINIHQAIGGPGAAGNVLTLLVDDAERARALLAAHRA